MTAVNHMLDSSASMARSIAARWGWTRVMSFGFTALALAFLVAMLATFVWQSFPVWQHEDFGYLTGKRWFFRQHQFGALAMIYGSAVVSGVALLLAGPVGMGAAVFTAEILPNRWRLPVKVGVELLAGVPSVIYGLLGILFLREWIYDALQPFDPLSGDTLLTAGILLAVMVLPTVMTLSDDALRSVPAAQRRAARGLGLTRVETVLAVSLPQAWRGMLAALLLALGRALGEGIAVFMVVGRQDNQWPENLFSLRPLVEAGQTLNSKLVGSETNIAYGDPLHWAAMMSLGLVLLAMAAGITWTGAWLMRRKEVHAPRA
jgi:phosphate transport system permease protein